MLPRFCIVAIIIIVALAPLALADYHYASHSGSNTYPYTSWETATDSVNAAVDAADPSDTVFIAAGEYEGLVVMYPADSLIAIIGAGADSTHLFTHQEHHLVYVGPKTYLKGMTFSTVWPYDAIYAAQKDVIVDNCYFAGLGGGIQTSRSNIIVRNSVFENLEDIGIDEQFSANISLEITNCLFQNVRAEPVNVYSYHAVITNNIVVNQTNGYSPFFIICSDNCYSYIANNII